MSFETFAVAAYTYYPVVWRKVYDDALRASHLWQPEATELDVLLMRVTGFIAANPLFGRNNYPNMVKAGFIISVSFYYHRL